MRKQQPTPVEPGKNSTEAGAVQAAGTSKASVPTRGKDMTFKVPSTLTTRIIAYGHYAYLALEKPDAEVDLEVCKRLWIKAVNDLLTLRAAAGCEPPRINGVDVRTFYGAPKAKSTRTETQIKKLEARLAKLKAKQAKGL